MKLNLIMQMQRIKQREKKIEGRKFFNDSEVDQELNSLHSLLFDILKYPKLVSRFYLHSYLIFKRE